MNVENPSWYTNPYVWLIIALPLSAVIAGLITIRIAVVSDDGLVTDDYYKKGLEINKVLTRDKIAQGYQLSAEIVLDKAENQLEIELSASEQFPYPPGLDVVFLNKTRSGYDRNVLMSKVGENTYQSELPELIIGGWHVQISAEDWRLMEEITTTD